jgi:hypothetical protein
MTFAECSKMNVPADELWLCTNVPPDQRPIAQAYIWTSTGHTPLDRFPPEKFAPVPNQLAENFAIRAIEAQPADYAKAVFDDTWRVFGWPRQVFPQAATYDEYLFLPQGLPIPAWDDAHIGRYNSFSATYLRGNPETQVVNPFAVIIRDYQKYVWLPGTIYGLILLAGLGGIVLAWRRLGGEALLPWAVSLAMIVVPAATAEFDYRYVLPAVPFACLAAVMAFSPGTAGRAGLRELAGAVRRTVGGARTGSGSASASASRTVSGAASASRTVSGAASASRTGSGAASGSSAGAAADSGADSASDSAAAGAGDDERNLATDGA